MYQPTIALVAPQDEAASAFIVIVAIVSRQVYLRSAADACMADADEDPARMMLICCATMHARLQNQHSSIVTADANEPLRVRCREP